MFRVKKILLIATFVLAGILLMGCKTKKPKLASWQTEGYKQGDFGNVPKLDKFGQAIMTPELKNSREFVNWEKQLGMKKEMRVTWYYETNDHNPLSAINYEIGDTGVPLVDIVVLFAFNITKKEGTSKDPELWLNPNNKKIVDNAKKIITPLQEKGIKVVMDILPHHQGIGWKNLDDDMREKLLDQIGELMDKTGIDGVDIDEEYAGYGNNGIPYSVPNSFVNFAKRYRERFPNKLLTMYDYNTPGYPEEKYLDFIWPDYGSSASNRYSREKTGYSIHTQGGNVNYYNVKNKVQQIREENRGVLMFFNINGKMDLSSGFSAITEELYGHPVTYKNRVYPHWK